MIIFCCSIGKHVKEVFMVYFRVLHWYFHAGTGEDHENPHWG
jgi:hypothetical protein